MDDHNIRAAIDQHWAASAAGDQVGEHEIYIPAAVSAFPEELYQAPRSWTEKAYPKLIHYNKLPKGGHFAAWEQPELLSMKFARDLSHCAR